METQLDRTIYPPLLQPDESFSVGQSTLQCYTEAERTRIGFVALCTKGKAELMLDNEAMTIHRHRSLFVMPGTTLLLKSCSSDFRVRYFAFSSDLFAETTYRLPIDFLRELKSNPLQDISEAGEHKLDLWFQMLEYNYRDKEHHFRETIVKNRLQNALLEVCDKLLRRPDKRVIIEEPTSRKRDLFQRFMKLVSTHYREEREVNFYAQALCISTRYLSSIVRHTTNHTAKEIIDHAVVLEIKMLLQSTQLSVQEIAYQLHFPDQSYLGRYFRKHTGQSPSDFRKTRR